MALHQYIGARYVPKFYENSLGTAEWVAGVMYEALTVVTWNGNSYTSKKTVPANIGDPSANPAYWVATGIFNQQVADLSDRMTAAEGDITGLQGNVDRLDKKTGYYTPEMFGAAGDGVTDDAAAFRDMIHAMSTGDLAVLSSPVYLIESTVNITTNGLKICSLNNNNVYPRIQTHLASGFVFDVAAAGVSFAYIRLENLTGLGLNSAGAFRFNCDTPLLDGNIDSYMYGLEIQGFEYGMVTYGRNLHAYDCVMGSVRKGFVFNPCVNIITESRGHTVKRCRFHGTSTGIENNIDAPATYQKNIIVEDNIVEAGSLFLFNGFGGAVCIQRNDFFILPNASGLAVYIKAQSDSNENRYDVISANTLYGRGANVGLFRCEDGCKVILKDNYVENCLRAAIFVQKNGKCVIANNTTVNAQPSSYALAADVGTTGVIANNIVIGSASAVSSSGCTLENNILL